MIEYTVKVYDDGAKIWWLKSILELSFIFKL